MSHLVYRSFDGRRRKPLVEKVIRDGENMYEHARHVIVINDAGVIVENFENNDIGKQRVNCIAILGPVIYHRKNISLAVLLEIGLKRFVPYATAEYKTKKGVKCIPPRAPIARMSNELTLKLLPELAQKIQHAVDTEIKTWENTLPVYVSARVSKTLKGKVTHTFDSHQEIFVKIPTEEGLLSKSFLHAERAWRSSPGKQYEVLIKSVVEKLSEFLKLSSYKMVESIPEDKIKKSRICSLVANMFKRRISQGYTEFAIKYVLNHMKNNHRQEFEILQRIFEVYKIPDAVVDDLERDFEDDSTQTANAIDLNCYRSARHQEKRKKHAANCRVFSVLASMQATEEMMASYMERKASRSRDEEIPF